jgi:hypothetical protein
MIVDIDITLLSDIRSTIFSMLFRAFPSFRVKYSPERPEVYVSEENNFPSGPRYFKQVILVPMLFSTIELTQ